MGRKKKRRRRCIRQSRVGGTGDIEARQDMTGS
jgi:hypothetical protein